LGGFFPIAAEKITTNLHLHAGDLGNGQIGGGGIPNLFHPKDVGIEGGDRGLNEGHLGGVRLRGMEIAAGKPLDVPKNNLERSRGWSCFRRTKRSKSEKSQGEETREADDHGSGEFRNADGGSIREERFSSKGIRRMPTE